MVETHAVREGDIVSALKPTQDLYNAEGSLERRWDLGECPKIPAIGKSFTWLSCHDPPRDGRLVNRKVAANRVRAPRYILILGLQLI